MTLSVLGYAYRQEHQDGDGEQSVGATWTQEIGYKRLEVALRVHSLHMQKVICAGEFFIECHH